MTVTRETFRVATHNIPPFISDVNALEAFYAATDDSDVVLLQEVTHLWREIQALARFKWYMPPEDSRSNIPILWNPKKFECITTISRMAYEGGQTIEHVDGLPSHSHDKWWNAVLLEHLKTGIMIGFGTLHPIPGIQPVDGSPARPVRTGLHYVHVSSVANEAMPTLTDWGADAVVFGADWNATPDHKNMNILRRGPDRACDSIGTPSLGTRSIDDFYRYDIGLATLSVVDQNAVPTESDHKLAWIEYAINN